MSAIYWLILTLNTFSYLLLAWTVLIPPPDLSDSGNQLVLFVMAVIFLDIILTIFAFGYIQTQERKKYKRLGAPLPYFNRQYTPLGKITRALFRRRPSPLGTRIANKLRPKSYYINGHKSLFKRSSQHDVDTKGEFRPAIDHEYNDAQIQQRFANYFFCLECLIAQWQI